MGIIKQEHIAILKESQCGQLAFDNPQQSELCELRKQAEEYAAYKQHIRTKLAMLQELCPGIPVDKLKPMRVTQLNDEYVIICIKED